MRMDTGMTVLNPIGSKLYQPRAAGARDWGGWMKGGTGAFKGARRWTGGWTGPGQPSLHLDPSSGQPIIPTS